MAPRVLVDATDVPADRGALGRYVDGLIGALDVAGADLAVVCQRADEERYGRLAPHARIVTGPTALSHRSARLAWEQSGLPVVAQQVNADVIHVPYYSMPLRPGKPTVVTVHDVTFFTEPELYSPVSAMFSMMRRRISRNTISIGTTLTTDPAISLPMSLLKANWKVVRPSSMLNSD